MSARRHWNGLPFTLKFSAGVFRGEIKVELGGGHRMEDWSRPEAKKGIQPLMPRWGATREWVPSFAGARAGRN